MSVETTIKTFKVRQEKQCVHWVEDKCTRKNMRGVEFILPNGHSRIEVFCDYHIKAVKKNYKVEKNK